MKIPASYIWHINVHSMQPRIYEILEKWNRTNHQTNKTRKESTAEKKSPLSPTKPNLPSLLPNQTIKPRAGDREQTNKGTRKIATSLDKTFSSFEGKSIYVKL